MTDRKTRNALYILAHFDNICKNAGGENIETSLAFVFFLLICFLVWADKV